MFKECSVTSLGMPGMSEGLHANIDIFAWKPLDMPGIPREVAEHSLNIRPGSKPVKQRLR